MNTIEYWQEFLSTIDTSTSKPIAAALKQQGLLEPFVEFMEQRYGSKNILEYYFLAVNNFSQPKICPTGNNRPFAGYTVGYRGCGKANTCECVRKEVSEKVSQTKLAYTDEQKLAIHEKRVNTVLDKYGTSNVFQLESVKEKSKSTIMKLFGVENASQSDELKKAKEITNLKRYGTVNPAQSAVVKDKMKSTNLERYGVEYAFSNAEVQATYKQTMIERYGVDNPNKVSNIKSKIKQTNLERYSVDNPSKSPLIKQKIKESQKPVFFQTIVDRLTDTLIPKFDITTYNGAKKYYPVICRTCQIEFDAFIGNGIVPKCKNCTNNISIPQFEIGEFIKSLGFEIEHNNRKIIAPLEIDIYIPELKMGIEYCGLRWHGEKNSSKDKQYHLNKLQLMNKQGKDLITIFSDEYNYLPDIVFQRIQSRLKTNKNRNKWYARKLQVQYIDSNTSDRFLERYHIQGKCNASIRLGLFNKTELIAVMTFSKTRFGNGNYELVRYSSNDIIVGGVERLFNRFIQDYNPIEIVSYADLRWSKGELYYKLGFNLDHISTPNYWYYVYDRIKKRMNRLNFTKKKLVKQGYDPNKTEWEIMQELGYDRIWDCGNLVFKWEAK
jgi:hypothetical protein